MALAASLALLPASWASGIASPGAVGRAVSPSVPHLEDDGQVRIHPSRHHIARIHGGLAHHDKRGLAVADSMTGPGLLASYFLPVQLPGLYRLVIDDVHSGGPMTRDLNQAIIRHRRVLPAVQEWEVRHYKPIAPTDEGSFRFDYLVSRLHLGYLTVGYGGMGPLSLGAKNLDFYPLSMDLADRPLTTLATTPTDGAGVGFRSWAMAEMRPGRYVAHFSVSGLPVSTLFERQPSAVALALLLLPAGTPRATAAKVAAQWASQDRRLSRLIATQGAVWPLAEKLAAPWWTLLPDALHGAYDLTVTVPRPSALLMLAKYDGTCDLGVPEIVLETQALDRGRLPGAGQ